MPKKPSRLFSILGNIETEVGATAANVEARFAQPSAAWESGRDVVTLANSFATLGVIAFLLRSDVEKFRDMHTRSSKALIAIGRRDLRLPDALKAAVSESNALSKGCGAYANTLEAELPQKCLALANLAILLGQTIPQVPEIPEALLINDATF